MPKKTNILENTLMFGLSCLCSRKIGCRDLQPGHQQSAPPRHAVFLCAAHGYTYQWWGVQGSRKARRVLC